MTTRLRLSSLGALAVAALLAGATVPDAPVADAAMRGDLETVRSLVRQGADVNAPQGDGMTALHWAAENGQVEMAELLIQAGAGLEASTRIGGFTPLLVASRQSHGGVVAALIEAGADVGAATTTGETALHFSAAAGSGEAVLALLGHGAEVDATESANLQTPLMYAAASGRTAVVRLLLEAKADPELETRIVDYAAVEARDDAEARRREARLKVLHGQDVGAGRPVDGTSANEDEERPPASAPRERIPSRPLSYAELVGKQGGNTALHYAVREGHAEAASALLDGGADVNHVSGGDRTSALLMATLNGHFDLAMELLERGGDATLASDPGATPLYAAVHLQWVPKSFYPQPTDHKQQNTTYLELMKALLDAGADPDVRLERHLWYTSFNHNVLGVDTWGATPFWRAAWGTDVAAMKLLVAYGADPGVATRRPPQRRRLGGSAEGEEADPSGLLPVAVGDPAVRAIHAASGVGYGKGLAGNAHRHAPDGWLPTVRYLVEELGADVNARDHEGFTALHNAAARGDVPLILYLVEKGADVAALTRKGETVADMANGPVQRVTVFPEVVALLESLGSKNHHNCVSC